MPFQFRFKVLSRHRQYLLSNAQTALAAAQRQYEGLESQRATVKNQIQEQTQLWEEKQAAGIQVTDYLSFRDYVQSLERQLLKLAGEIERARKEVDKARKLLIEKEKEVKILESLKEQEKEAYCRIESRKEQKQVDEVAIFRDYYKKNST